MFNPEKPFNDLPLLPPKSDIETKAILKKAVTAGRALAELKGLSETIPDPAILINSIILQEAKASSEIENIITSSDRLFMAFSSKKGSADAATKEVLHYREALWNGYNSLKERSFLTTNLFIEIVQTIKQNQAGIRNIPGTAVVNAATGKPVFTPPEGEKLIRDLLKNLESYIHEDKSVDPLIKMAVIHYQFETIHPFSDGNGRTGRIVNILYLVMEGLLDLPILYLSQAIIKNKNEYYRLLREVTENKNWEAWALYMLSAIEETSILTRKKIEDIRNLLAETLIIAKEKLPERAYSKELIELLFHNPYAKGQFIIDAGIAKRQTAADYLKELENIGILEAHKSGKEILYLNKRLYQLLKT